MEIPIPGKQSLYWGGRLILLWMDHTILHILPKVWIRQWTGASPRVDRLRARTPVVLVPYVSATFLPTSLPAPTATCPQKNCYVNSLPPDFDLKCAIFQRVALIAFLSISSTIAFWRHRSTRSTLAQVMACCLAAPSHHLNVCWIIISEVQWRLPGGNFTRNNSAVNF